VIKPIIFEGDDSSYGWDKLTISFAFENKPKLLALINKELMKYGLAGRIEALEVYQELLLYLASTKDFDATPGRGNLESYVVVCLKNIVKRAVSSYYKYVSQLVYDMVCDDEELSAIDLMPDEGKMPDYINIEDEVRSAECLRYKYGVDIPLLVYLRFLCDDDETYRGLVELLLGIKYVSEFRALEKKVRQDEVFIAFISALSSLEREEALKALKKIVYGAESIERALQGH